MKKFLSLLYKINPMNTSEIVKHVFIWQVTMFILLLFLPDLLKAQNFPREIGVYPGNPDEDFSPILINDDTTYHNLALHRPAYHSSSYDYNLTAQLTTDGIIDTLLPSWISVSSSRQGVLLKNDRQRVLDRHRMTSIVLQGSSGWIQISLKGGNHSILVDSFVVSGSVLVDGNKTTGWECRISGSNDEKSWEEIANIEGTGYPGDSIPKQWRRWAPPNMRLFNYALLPDAW
jgi:hypothetical protein